jgi:hypothetical protein
LVHAKKLVKVRKNRDINKNIERVLQPPESNKPVVVCLSKSSENNHMESRSTIPKVDKRQIVFQVVQRDEKNTPETEKQTLFDTQRMSYANRNISTTKVTRTTDLETKRKRILDATKQNNAH